MIDLKATKKDTYHFPNKNQISEKSLLFFFSTFNNQEVLYTKLPPVWNSCFLNIYMNSEDLGNGLAEIQELSWKMLLRLYFLHSKSKKVIIVLAFCLFVSNIISATLYEKLSKTLLK